jgi:hypothetical protein
MANAQVYNANPVIFAPSSTVGRKPKYTAVQSLWINEDDVLHTGRRKNADSDEIWDPIDRDEIYGRYVPRAGAILGLIRIAIQI